MDKIEVAIAVGGVIEKDNKFLLIQEAKPQCRGKWSIPAGHLDVKEDIFTGTKREIKEESNCDVELTSICQIGNWKRKDLVFVSIIFAAKLISDFTPDFTSDEILSVKWFTYEEILAMKDQIRTSDLVIGAIENYRQGITAPIDIVKIYHEGAEYQKYMVQGE